MFKVKEIKIAKIVFCVSAVLISIVVILMFAMAANIPVYSRSRDVRLLRTFCIVGGVIFGLVAAVQYGLAIGTWILEKHGRVCPQCERVYSKLAERCPRCNCDMSHALSVREALISNPLLDNKQMMSSVGQNFCTICGEKLRSDNLFCPRCGKKIKS
ncbi:MAG: zinc-ribbon domain-containing protein [Acetatifactor sp.]|nr:zinc-ribbon domain-containing protein [Acetatifactor sp.]